MKRFLVCLVLVLGLTAIGQAQRLPETAVPNNYKLTFTPDFTNDTFGGDEAIHVNVPKATNKIVLNALEIKFEDVTVDAGGKSQKATVTTDEKSEMATLTVGNPIPAGAATVHIKFTGMLNDKLAGFYLSKSDKRKYAVTQFEATDARRAFPSFDEPAYKATFDIAIVADKGDTAISNGKIVSDTPGPGEGKHTLKFATTPKLSTYLVAMLVGDWKCVSDEVDGIPLRVCSVPGKEQMGAFALEATKNILHYYNQYFSMKYPFGKLDQVAIPDFEAGAMENAGAITYRESLLLADPKTASEDQKINIAGVIAHEVAHQWFGDLVTMKWWDDIWLNEGFATWMTPKPLEAWKPEWKQREQEVLDANDSINGDSVVATRPIHQAAETKGEINALFDGIAYGKTAAVLHMVESYISPDVFRAGVNRYLQQHSYANATAQDFWNTQTAVSKKPVDQIMRSFVMQPGVPFVDVNSSCSNGKTRINLAQKRYFYDPALFAKDTIETWNVPVCFQDVSGTKSGSKECQVLKGKQETFTLPACGSWVFPNSGAAGYYRYAFDTTAVKGAELETSLKPEERISLVANEWALVRAGRHSVPDYLSLVNSLRNERDSFVLEELTNRVEYIGRNLVTEQDRPEFQRWVRSFFRPVLNDIGLLPKPGEEVTLKELRPKLYGILGETIAGDDPEVVAQSQKLAQEYMQDPASVPPDLAGVVTKIAASHGDAALYDQYMAKLKLAKTPQEYYTYFYALARFEEPVLIQRTLDFALTDQVRNQDLYIIPSVMSTRAGSDPAWNFVKAHWGDLMSKAGGSIGSAAGLAFGATGSFCDAQKRDDVKAFYDDHKLPGTLRSFKAAQESINYCIDLKERQQRALAEWLQQNTVATR